MVRAPEPRLGRASSCSHASYLMLARLASLELQKLPRPNENPAVSAAPLFLLFTLHGRSIRVLDLEPIAGAAGDVEDYCEYRSQCSFPISISTLAIATYSTSEHPRVQPSHCRFFPKSREHASAPANTILPSRVLTPSLICSASFLLEFECRQSSMCLQMFFGLLHAA